jgi:glycosyltransferase involved in cell wall biosynthesis
MFSHRDASAGTPRGWLSGAVRVHVVDPPAYTPPYDHSLCAALARAGIDVDLVTTEFAYGEVPAPAGYRVRNHFYSLAVGRPGGGPRRAVKLAQHVPDMLRYRRLAREAAVVHFQWLAVQPVDRFLLPRSRPLVVTAHDVLPREPQPGQLRAQRRLYARMDAVVVHSQAGAGRLVDEVGVSEERVHVIPHGAFAYLAEPDAEESLPVELAGPEPGRAVALFFGLLRPYKGLDVLLEAWRGIESAELWVAGMPRMDIGRLQARAPANVRFVARYLSDAELRAVFRRADLAVLPYREADQSGVLFTALAFGLPLVLTAVGGFPEVAATGAARLVEPGDAEGLAQALGDLLGDAGARDAMAASARRAAAGPYSWDAVAALHVDLYNRLTAAPVG